MGTTLAHNLPFPDDLNTDNNPPADFRALALAVDSALTGATAAVSALLGGMKVQWGTFTVAIGTTASTVNVAFTAAFSAAPMVFCSLIDTAPVSTGHRVDRWGNAASDSIGLGDTTGFVFKSNRNSGSYAIRVTWIAIGAP